MFRSFRRAVVRSSIVLNPSLVDDTKVLGIPWNTCRDTFSFTIQHLPHDIRPFGHIVTSHVAICKEGKDWNEMLAAELSTKFQQWLSKATKAQNIEIDRCYTKNKEIKGILFVGFCDASKIGYAACIYLRAKHADESRSVKMIAAGQGLHH